MTSELIYPDFLGKSRHYTKRDIESGIPIVTPTESEVDQIAMLHAIECEVAQQLWDNDAGTVGYLAPGKDGA